MKLQLTNDEINSLKGVCDYFKTPMPSTIAEFYTIGHDIIQHVLNEHEQMSLPELSVTSSCLQILLNLKKKVDEQHQQNLNQVNAYKNQIKDLVSQWG